MPNLERETILWSIRHILEFGDTDIFPYPLEFDFFRDRMDEIAARLAQENIATYRPMSALESLVPKSRFGFRIAHQLFPVDVVMFTAAVVSIGSNIENARSSKGNNVAFSYRFEQSSDFSMFRDDCRFGDWLKQQYFRLLLSDEDEYSHVVETDISDFFMRIYHHRLENCLVEASGDKHVVGMINNFVRHIRARQSFGIPVGGNASRLLAELALVDIDQALVSEGYQSTRYVDDFRIFVKKGQDPYAALAFLADNLSTNDGLSLAIAKTRIVPIDRYKGELKIESGEDDHEAENSAVNRLFNSIYDSEDNEKYVLELGGVDLVAELQEEIDKEYWDIGQIRILLRCMKLAKDEKSVSFIRSNLKTLIPFVKELVLLMEALVREGGISFNDLEESVVDLILSPAASHLPVTRVWLMELFLRDTITLSPEQARRLYGLSTTLDQRSIIRIRAKLGEVHYFRRGKTRIHELNPWLQPIFIHSASCMPEDEYTTWIQNIRQYLHFPLADQYCDWARAQRRK